MNTYSNTTTVGNVAFSIYLELAALLNTDPPLLDGGYRQYLDESKHSCLLCDNDERIIDSHLFNLAQAEQVVGEFNEYLVEKLSVARLLAFLNAEAECFADNRLTVRDKKQRYLIIIVNALASTLWQHPGAQSRFVERCRMQLGVDKVTWDTQTSRIRSASARSGTVSRKALQLRDDLYDQLGIPPEYRI